MVGLGRLELPTSSLSGTRSNQLSYRPRSEKTGGAGRDRTGGLLSANQALSQLSYSPFGLGARGRESEIRIPNPYSRINLRGRLDAAGRHQAGPAK